MLKEIENLVRQRGVRYIVCSPLDRHLFTEDAERLGLEVIVKDNCAPGMTFLLKDLPKTYSVCDK